MNSGQGYTYDAAGNTLTDANGQSYIYDGENKQTKASNGGGTLGEYWYDGDGKRVKKIVPDTGEVTVFVYDAAGKQIAEYSTIVESVEDAKVAYLTSDHLGSPRINTDRDGAVTSRHDYHPYGEEIITAQRTSHAEYTPDSVRKQFTGYERDGESGLDFAQARHHKSALGRFTSPDLLGGAITDPQTLNKYSYVINNPLTYIDPSGLCGTTAGSPDDSPCIWLVKDGLYQSISESQYGDGSGYDGWSRVADPSQVTLTLSGLNGTYADDAEYQSFVENGTIVGLGANGRFEARAQTEVTILDDTEPSDSPTAPSMGGLNPFFNPLPWRSPLTSPGPEFRGPQPPWRPTGPGTSPGGVRLPVPQQPTNPLVQVPARPGVPQMNPNTPNIGPDASLRVRATLVLTQIVRVLTGGGQVVPPQQISPIIVCRPCLINPDDLRRRFEIENLEG